MATSELATLRVAAYYVVSKLAATAQDLGAAEVAELESKLSPFFLLYGSHIGVLFDHGIIVVAIVILLLAILIIFAIIITAVVVGMVVAGIATVVVAAIISIIVVAIAILAMSALHLMSFFLAFHRLVSRMVTSMAKIMAD